MQEALNQASAAIDAAVQSYAGEIATMKQEIAAKQAAMEQEAADRKTEITAMGTALTQHQARYSAISALRTAPDQAAPQPVPVAVVGDAPVPAGGLRSGSDAMAGSQSDSLSSSLSRLMLGGGSPVAIPYPTTPPGV